MTYDQAQKLVQKFAAEYTRGDFDEAVSQMDMARDCLRAKEKEAFYIIKAAKETK